MKPLPALFLLSSLILLGCNSSLSPPAPTTAPATAAEKQFASPDAGIAFNYPADWKPVPGTKSQLRVAASDGGQFGLDVPKLPFHIPGMIPVDSVASGYVDDFKKQMPDAVETKLPDPTLPDAKQRRLKLTGHVNGKSAIDEAVLVVHNDHVYILAIDTDEHGYPQMHAGLDAVLTSLNWAK